MKLSRGKYQRSRRQEVSLRKEEINPSQVITQMD